MLSEYPRLVKKEFALAKDGEKLSTFYMGGGTPGLLGAKAIGEIMEAAQKSFGLAPSSEITIETNPCVDNDFAALRGAGINRVSIGAQALDDEILTRLGRAHTSAEALASIAAALKAGVSVSADLIYGHAGSSPAKLSRWAKELAALGVGHISAYSLETPKSRKKAQGLRRAGIKKAGASEEAQHKALLETLSAEGFHCYEVSNFARPGFESRHNKVYWSGESYIGAGPGAHGFLKEIGPYGTRYENSPSLEKYRASLLRGEPPPRKSEELSWNEALLETLFLALRQNAPLKPEKIALRYGLKLETLRDSLSRLAQQGDLCAKTLSPTLKGMQRADGLALWLLDRLL